MLARLLAIHPGEGRIAFRLCAHNFVALASSTILLAVAESLFLIRYKAGLLPYTYLISALTTTLGGALYEVGQRRLAPRTLSGILTSGVFLTLSSCYALCLVAPQAGTFLLLCLTAPCSVLLSLENTAMAARALDTRSARRLFPAIGAVGGIGATGGAFLVSLLATHIPPIHMAPIGIAFAILVLPFAFSIQTEHQATAPHGAASWKTIFSHRFATMLIVLAFLLGILSTCVRYQLSGCVQDTLAPEKIAPFFGLLYGGLNAASILFQLVLSRAALTYLGVATSLIVYPALMAALAGTFLLFPILPFAATLLVVERLTRQNLQRPALVIAGMPIPDDIRVRTTIAVRGWLESVAISVASLLLLVVSLTLHWSTVSWIVFAAALIGTGCALVARSGYVRELVVAMRARRLRMPEELEDPAILDPQARALLEKQLTSEIPEQALLALYALRGKITATTVAALQSHWTQRPAWFRTQVVQHLAEDTSFSAFSFLRSLSTDGTPEVQIELTRLELAGQTDEALTKLAKEGPLQADALDHLYRRHGWRAIREPLLASSPAVAARVITSVELEMTTIAPDRDHLALLCSSALDDDASFETAREALLRLHPTRIPSSSPRALSVLAEIDVTHVLPLLADADPEVRTRAAHAISHAPSVPTDALYHAIEREIACARRLQTLALRAEGVVREEADLDFNRALDRLFTLLHLAQAIDTIPKAHLAITSGDRRERSFAVEWLEESLDPRWRRPIIELLEKPDPHAVVEPDPWLQRIANALATPGMDPPLDRSIKLKRRSPFRFWRLRDLEAVADGCPDSSDPLVLLQAESVRHAIAHRSGCGAAWLRDLASEAAGSTPSAHTARILPSLASHVGRVGHIHVEELELLRRMFFLRAVLLFKEFAPERLRLLAQVTSSQSASAGTTIIRQGRPGHSFYMVCSGRVSVERDGRTVATLGETETFGEFALLSGQVRTATVRAIDSCELLTIDRFDFLDLVETHPEIVHTLTHTILERWPRSSPCS